MLFIVVLAVGSVFFFVVTSQKQMVYENAVLDLKNKSRLFRKFILDHLGDQATLQKLSKEVGDSIETQFTVISSSGEVLSDSHGDPIAMDNHRTHLEIAAALEGKVGTAHRYSFTLKKKLLYVALPLRNAQGEIMAVVRSSSALGDFNEQILQERPYQVLMLILILLVSGILMWFGVRKILKPIDYLRGYIEDLAEGNLKARFEIGSVPEGLSSVGIALSKIAKDLRSSQKAIIKGQIQQDVILKNMDEGVIFVNEHRKVNHINLSAKKILDITVESEKELAVRELIRLPVLRKFIEKALLHQKKREREIIIDEGEVSERIFIVRSSPIFSVKSKYQGSIFVLVDVSELRKLERHRQEFVSNVSHELKTPLTSIKGYAETMLNPALNSQDHLQAFSKVIQKHADHLDSLIDDLLMLSELESGDQVFNDQLFSLEEIIKGAMDVCFIKAKKRGIQIDILSSDSLEVRGNPTLLTQALINLVDNAIKYSPEGTTVKILSHRGDSFVHLRVVDEGPGIPESHQARLFERFYRIDGGRSRDMGGTGLGLSIVRHIMYAHGGEVGVESELGQGSQFYLKIPVSEKIASSKE